jgi:uncharacterized membrane protein
MAWLWFSALIVGLMLLLLTVVRDRGHRRQVALIVALAAGGGVLAEALVQLDAISVETTTELMTVLIWLCMFAGVTLSLRWGTKT